MLRSVRFALLAVSVLAAPPAFADDAALAAKLVGDWEGRWEFEKVGDKVTATFASAAGNVLKGTTLWYGTAVGDFKDAFTKAKLKDGKLTVPESTMDFVVTVSEDGTSMTGTWTSPMASGTVTLKKRAAAQ